MELPSIQAGITMYLDEDEIHGGLETDGLCEWYCNLCKGFISVATMDKKCPLCSGDLDLVDSVHLEDGF